MSAILKPNFFEKIPSADELVQRAQALVPILRSRAEEVEKNRSVPSEIIQEFVKAGFFKVLQPKKWGGWEMEPQVFWKILMELGRGCSSSAWNMMILGVHQWEFGVMSEQAGNDVWGEDPSVIVASSYATAGTVTPVEGGYVLEGAWPTSSGTDHGQWAFIGGVLKNQDGVAYDRLSFLVPRADYELIDDWHVFGLAGTGSKSLRITKAFVPTHRAHSVVKYTMSDRGETYLYPFMETFWASVSAVICGFGQAAIDCYREQMKGRQRIDSNTPVAVSPYVKDRLGNAVIRVSSAKSRLFQIAAETSPIVQQRKLVPLEMRVRHLAEIAQVGRNIEEATLLLYKATASRGIFLNNPFQRILRDVLAATNHVTQNGDDTAGLLGGYLLGVEPPPLIFGALDSPVTA